MSETKDSGVVSIHGKQYQTVALRVKNFREKYQDWTLETRIVSRDDECVVMQALITDEVGRLRATGHSEEYRASSTINRTSALENAETSAIGRALAALGMGGTEFATADEVANALKQQQQGSTITALQAATDAFNALPKARQNIIVDKSIEIADLLKANKDAEAFAFYESAVSDSEERLALWSRLDSKQRSRLKAQSPKKAA